MRMVYDMYWGLRCSTSQTESVKTNPGAFSAVCVVTDGCRLSFGTFLVIREHHAESLCCRWLWEHAK